MIYRIILVLVSSTLQMVHCFSKHKKTYLNDNTRFVRELKNKYQIGYNNKKIKLSFDKTRTMLLHQVKNINVNVKVCN